MLRSCQLKLHAADRKRYPYMFAKVLRFPKFSKTEFQNMQKMFQNSQNIIGFPKNRLINATFSRILTIFASQKEK